MNQTLDIDIATTWSNMVPKVLELAKDADVTGLQQFLDTYTYDVVSDGKYTYRWLGHLLYSFIFITLGYRNILALCCLVYMAPDVRSKVDHTKVVTLLEVSY